MNNIGVALLAFIAGTIFIIGLRLRDAVDELRAIHKDMILVEKPSEAP